MKAREFVEKLVEIAENVPTLYVNGGIGAAITSDNVKRYTTNTEYNRRAERTEKIKAAADQGVFGFDCVCLIKSVLWGWNGDASAIYGGAVYKSNGVPDATTEGMLALCNNVRAEFHNIKVGEYLWKKGHCGVYIGDGLAVECTPIWADGVQITAVANIGAKDGYNARTWEKHGELPWIDYEAEEAAPSMVAELIAVYKLQTLLNLHGAGLDVDGSFGSLTRKALQDFQRENGLEANGVCDLVTLGKLLL